MCLRIFNLRCAVKLHSTMFLISGLTGLQKTRPIAKSAFMDSTDLVLNSYMPTHAFRLNEHQAKDSNSPDSFLIHRAIL